MIVIDASALVEALLPTARAQSVRARLLSSGGELHAPHLIDVECAQVIRRLVAAGKISLELGARALRDLAEFPIDRHGHTLLLPRIWEWRNNLTAYDAAYVALAEALDAPLVTCDARLAAAPGHRATVEVV